MGKNAPQNEISPYTPPFPPDICQASGGNGGVDIIRIITKTNPRTFIVNSSWK